MNWLLSDVQKEAVTTTEGPILVFAGAGSGKTRVITYRIAYLLQKKNIAPENIVAVTFTNKAAKEMKERVAEIINNDDIVRQLTICTFHSLGLQILKREHKHVDYPANFVIYTPYEQTELLKKVMDQENVSRERFSARSILSLISGMKNNPAQLKQSPFSTPNLRYPIARKLYKPYNQALKVAGAMDFDDLILKVIQLFDEKEDIKQKYANRFKYIMVDEYQDTNHAQYKIVSDLASGHNNICVVGDDDQSIYSWRGAQVENILNFHTNFDGCKVIKLEQNYRSVDEIVNAAGKLITFNKKRADKRAFTQTQASEHDGIEVGSHLDEQQEAEFVTKKIQELSSTGKKFGDIAILIRANNQSRPFEINFNKHHIPYKIIGGQKFFENKEIKDLSAYLRIIANPNDEISFRRVINYPARGIGATTQEKLFNICALEKSNVVQVCAKVERYDHFKPAAKQAVKDFVTMYNNLRNSMKTMQPVAFAKHLIAEIKIEQELIKSSENDTVAKIKMENIKEFINAVSYAWSEKEYKSNLDFYFDFINSISLVQSGEEDTKNNAVNIITAHSAKGLEYDTVFLIGFYNGGMPNRMAIEEGNIEEERRLCYVAITRAKKKLFISWPETVRNRGKIESVKKSMFLVEAGLGDQKFSAVPKTDNLSDLLEKMRSKINS